MNEQVDAGAKFYDVLVIAGVARNHYRATFVFDTIAYGRLDGLAVIDCESNHFDAILVIDDAVLLELLHDRCDALGRQLFVLQPDFDVESISTFQVSHQRLGADRPNQPEWLLPALSHPPRQP